jgi:hypothetical protein
MAEVRARLTADVGSTFETLSANVSAQLDSTTKSIKAVQQRVRELELLGLREKEEAQLATAKRDGVHGNVLIAGSELASIAKELRDATLLHTVAVDVLDALRAIVRFDDDRIAQFTLSCAENVMESLPNELSVIRQEMAQLVNILKLRKPEIF